MTRQDTHGSGVVLHRDEQAMLEAVYRFRLLTRIDAHAIVCPDKTHRWAQDMLNKLWRLGLLDRVREHSDRTYRYFVTYKGARAVDEEAKRVKLVTPEKASGPKSQHMLDGNRTAIQFMRHARLSGDEMVPYDAQVEVPLWTGMKGRDQLLVADLALSYTQIGEADDFIRWWFVEVDRGNMAPHLVAQKALKYQAAFDHGKWKDTWPRFPGVVFVFCEGGQKKPGTMLKNVRAMVDAWSETGRVKIPVWMSTFRELVEHGPYGEVWRPSGAAKGMSLL